MVKKIYNVKTVFPVDETVKGNKQTTTKHTDILTEVGSSDVVKLFKSYREGNYKVSCYFQAPIKKEKKNEELSTPFDVAKSLAKQGIDYRATLKIKSKGSYQDMLKAMHLVESEGFDMTVNVKLKINDQTTTNIDDEHTWVDEDPQFKVTPKTGTNNINELKSLYASLNKKGYETIIDIKPKAPKADDMDSKDDAFATQLLAYPDGTMVKFKLSQDND
ncbi:hypothetical protein L2784_10080 [Lactobacillus crispatus]|uniref:hypothetical protein n=1 Tax=Lactobacillus crispatus TaxID=47770 RepID=UPI0022AC49EB|nr:hypothetical protein [Lactobacillus crispatus]MCT7821098.1 hypothetical protein [Lactobacillus crispatus]MCZ3643004.1 hypothetical protein [Lactobacillus crispatus]MCZ3645401.1 hypothetical protein [Lactobacillus crispatus]MCZ3647823.1 hypothetical protein [Lactobacillus crispatus]MCZ3650167.1 hypothetical protein [Lactobacillus crispatus]